MGDCREVDHLCHRSRFLGAGLPTHAQAAVTHYELNIPREPLDRALKQFAEQTGLQVARFSDISQGTSQTGPVIGHFTTEEALSSLLAGSGLGYRILSHQTIAIVRAHAGGPGSSSVGSPQSNDQKAQRSFADSFRMAQVAQGATAGDSAVTGVTAGKTTEEMTALKEVIVTAQLYRQPAREVPGSLDVISADELQQRGVRGLEDLQYAVPGMHVQGGAVQPRIFLRGTSNWWGNGPQVSQYIDDADITAPGVAGTFGYGQFDVPVYDLQRVEVLRGPQGTLYGAGAEAGTIRFITRQPLLNRFQADADLIASFTPDGAPGQRIQAMVNTPLILGNLGLRVVGDFDHEGGWIDEPAANIKNFNSADIVNVRIEGLWQPMSRLTVKLMQLIDRNSFGINHGEDAQLGIYDPVFGVTTPGHGQRQGNLTNLAITYDFDSLRLLSSSTYFRRGFSVYDMNQYTSPEGPAPYYDEFQQGWENDKDFSQELRLSNAGAGPWKWTTGAFYQRDTDEGVIPYYYAFYGNTFVDPATAPLPPLYYYAYPKETSKSWSAFANVSYRFLNRITLGVGSRYFRNDYYNMYPGVSGSGQLLPGPASKATFTSTDPRFFLEYRATSHINAYASAAKGFRSGGFNFFSTEAPYGPESVWSYELGTKTRFLQDRLAIDADVFHTDYRNYVVLGYFPSAQGPGAPTNFLYENAGKARIRGVEANVKWRLSDNWMLGINGDSLDSKLISLGAAQGTGFAPGDNLPFVPKYSATASVQRNVQWDGRSGYAALYYSQQGPVQFRVYGPPAEFGESDTIRLLNFSAAIQWTDGLRLGVSAENLLNDRGFVDPFHAIWWDWSARERPRTYDINFGFRFD